MGHYDRVAAASYAIKWGFSRNLEFKDYSSSAGDPATHGGDCTNFLSQCLLAGGWDEIGGLAHDPTVWNRNSHSWASPQWFNWFMRWTDRSTRCDRDELQIGDIVLLDRAADKAPHHGMIVTYTRGSEVWLSGHSNNRVQYPLSMVLASSPHDELICWHILPAYSSALSELEDLSPALIAARKILGK